MIDEIKPHPFAFSIKQNLILSLLLVIVAPMVMFSSFLLAKSSVFHTITKSDENTEPSIFSNIQYGVQVYASLPSEVPSISTQIGAADARVAIVKQYLSEYDSPLYPYADYIVEKADDNGIDYRLTTAIAQQESNLCKIIPPGSFNCWGWGIHSQGTLGFSSYADGIATVSQGLKANYINKGFTTIDEIMTKYTPLSNGSWANGVSTFMNEMR